MAGKRTIRMLAVPIFCVTMLVGLTLSLGAANVTIEKTAFEGWNNCYRMSNGEVELIAVADIGPRILRFGFVGGQNLLFVDPETQGKTGGDEWVGYGGHRFWIAPELLDVTYYPDNIPVHAEIEGNTLRLISIPEIHDEKLRSEVSSWEEAQKRMKSDAAFQSKIGLQKIITITMSEEGEVTIEHVALQHGEKAMEIAPWALTVMAQKGLTIIPNIPYAPHGPDHFLPERSIALWSYSDLTDPRFKLMEKFWTIRQNPDSEGPNKIGLSDTGGWVAYALERNLFVKILDYTPGENYPDMGSSVEIFTNPAIMEIESLGPLKTLKKGDSLKHSERWRLYKLDEEVEQTAESVEKAVGVIDFEHR